MRKQVGTCSSDSSKVTEMYVFGVRIPTMSDWLQSSYYSNSFFQSLSHLMWRTDSLEKTLVLDKIEGRKRRGQQRTRSLHHWLNGHEFKQTLGDSEGQEAWCATIHGVSKSYTWLSDWTATTMKLDQTHRYKNQRSGYQRRNLGQVIH